MRNTNRHLFLPAAALLTLLLCFSLILSASAEAVVAKPSVNGRLHEENGRLTDEQGTAVQLQGLSTHGLTWYPEFVDEQVFTDAAEVFGSNAIRLAMYSEEYVKDEATRQTSLELVRKGIDAAIAADLYVIVDWHVLEDANPLTYMDDAIGFFQTIASEYADCPNILYEICNEPNSGTAWEDIRQYAEQVIPVIRALSPQSVIVVGTPDYDREPPAADQLLPYENLFYTFHFYAATPDAGSLDTLKAAVDSGIPMFVTECGLSEDTGDGRLGYTEAAAWFTYLKSEGIPYCVWSLSDKAESSALLRQPLIFGGTVGNCVLTACGQWIRDLMRGTDPAAIPAYGTGMDEFVRLIRAELWAQWAFLAGIAVTILAVTLLVNGLVSRAQRKKHPTYNDLLGEKRRPRSLAGGLLLIVSAFCSLVYLTWRVLFSVPWRFGWLSVALNFLLLAVELLGFVESIIHYSGLMSLRDYPLPQIADDEYPDVDIFIATYNEPEELLTKTVNCCLHLQYPDPKKVHIYLCDDHRRPAIRALAERLGVNYFDRPDNKGAKAGNLNHALERTHSPYVVTLDADMIPRHEFLMKTIPYFVDAEKRNAARPEGERIPLGFIQTPQAFYTPDVFQHNLYAERRIPNEQDFFYRTIESFRTATNSVIYGGSNTIISRAALEAIGGVYTECITEDFATGMLIESAGYVALGLSEPLASGMAPSTFREHIQQRTRWGRGVIVTARKLRLLRRKGLSLAQKLNYQSSVVYWYSPVKNLVYMLSPLMFAAFALPVFRCTAAEMLIFWLPMFLLQNACLRILSGGRVSAKRSGVQETAVMPFLLIPIVKESLGITLSAFKVTDKQGGAVRAERSPRLMAPFLLLLALHLWGIIRVCVLMAANHDFSLVILLFWLIRNSYYLLMSLFLVLGRDTDGESVLVHDGVPMTVQPEQGGMSEAITTLLTEHSLSFFPDDSAGLRVGTRVTVTLLGEQATFTVRGVLTGRKQLHGGETASGVYTCEILDFDGHETDWLQLLYDRVPTLPQSLKRDIGLVPDLLINLGHRLSGE